jgi:hypothetical protein
MSGYTSDGVLSISSTISTENRDQSLLSSWNDEEKGQLESDSTEHGKKPWHAKYELESDMDIALQGTTSP